MNGWITRWTAGLAEAAVLTVLWFGGLTARAAPANDNCANATVLTSGLTSSSTTVGATLDGPATNACGGNALLDLWYKFTAVRTGTATLTADPGGLGPISRFAEVYPGTCGALGVAVACQSGINSGSFIINVPVVGATTYLVRVGVGSPPDTPYLLPVRYVDPAVPAAPTAFTYQGRLLNAGSPVTGPVEMSFRLYDAPNFGLQLGPTVTRSNLNIDNGLFVTTLDFGASPFSGSDRWLEITAGGLTLAPRQQITPVPYALFAVSGSAALAAAPPGVDGTTAAASDGGSSGVTIHNRVTGTLPTASYSGSSFQAIAGTREDVNLPAGAVTVTWSLSGRSTANGLFEVRPTLAGAGPSGARWMVNPANTHMSTSGSYSAHVAGGLVSVQLEIRSVNGGTFTTDQNDNASWTMTVYQD